MKHFALKKSVEIGDPSAKPADRGFIAKIKITSDVRDLYREATSVYIKVRYKEGLYNFRQAGGNARRLFISDIFRSRLPVSLSLILRHAIDASSSINLTLDHAILG